MANERYNEVSIVGESNALAAVRRIFAQDIPDGMENASILESTSMEFSVTFSTRSDVFELLEPLIEGKPDVVVTIGTVELGNKIAEARVYDPSGEVGRYEMEDDEVDELAGEDLDEAAVMSSLFETVASYHHDAVQKLKPANPAPTA